MWVTTARENELSQLSTGGHLPSPWTGLFFYSTITNMEWPRGEPLGHFSPHGPTMCRLRTVAEVEPSDVIEAIITAFPGLAPKRSWGETSLFYNPDGILPNGVYFATVKEHDGANDKASHLDRPGVFRLSFGLPATRYESLFGPRPTRPAKGGCVATGHDFTAIDELMPHPVYGWMGWVQILCPSKRTFAELQPLLSTAHQGAMEKYGRQVTRQKT